MKGHDLQGDSHNILHNRDEVFNQGKQSFSKCISNC